MAIVLPKISGHRFDSNGEKRFAERVAAKLDDDCLGWCHLTVGPIGLKPDFVLLHPRLGLIVLEVKDWPIKSIVDANPEGFRIKGKHDRVRRRIHPLKQAEDYLRTIRDDLECDSYLMEPPGSIRGDRLRFPWGYGLVLTNIRRKDFESAGLDRLLTPQRVICQDEMVPNIDAERFAASFRRMVPFHLSTPLSVDLRDSVRSRLYPNLRVGSQVQASLDLEHPGSEGGMDLVRVMDIQQEVLARTMGWGHRIIHGVAGSGKTMVLIFRCRELAKVARQPILVLCYNVCLASVLRNELAPEIEGGHVIVESFHKWCRELLVENYVPVPPACGEGFYEKLIAAVGEAAGDGRIPAGQSKDTVKVLTMHGSKGLEFEAVAIPGIGDLPSKYKNGRVDDEVRLLYVAMTRAMELLLTYRGESDFVKRLQCAAR